MWQKRSWWQKVRGWLDKKPCWYFLVIISSGGTGQIYAASALSKFARKLDQQHRPYGPCPTWSRACDVLQVEQQRRVSQYVESIWALYQLQMHEWEHEGKTPIRRIWNFTEWCEKFVGLIPHNFVIEGKYVATRNLGKYHLVHSPTL